jgi:hypothetical protein
MCKYSLGYKEEMREMPRNKLTLNRNFVKPEKDETALEYEIHLNVLRATLGVSLFFFLHIWRVLHIYLFTFFFTPSNSLSVPFSILLK